MTVEQGKTGLFRLFSLRHDFPDQWHQFLHAAPVNGEPAPLTLELVSALFPAYARERTIKIRRLLVMVQAGETEGLRSARSACVLRYPSGELRRQAPWKRKGCPATWARHNPAILDLGAGVIVREAPDQSVWKFAPTQIPGLLRKTVDTPDGAVDVLDPESLRDMAVLCHYTIE